MIHRIFVGYVCLLTTLVLSPAVSLATVSSFGGYGMPYQAFANFPTRQLEVSGAALEVAFAPGDYVLPQSALLSWVEQSARATATYYGRFPVSRVQILVLPVSGAGIRTGTSYGYNGAAIKVSVGTQSGQRHLANDWVMTHEMVHLALPGMRNAHHWIEEGIATYVEPIARAQAGELSPERVWSELVGGLPNGLPAGGDRGLDHTPTWGRTYWGGALFCLLADVEIRSRIGNRFGLQDALIAVNRAGGNIEKSWSIVRVLDIGDEATGVPVLRELYDRMKAAPLDPDLDALWKRLGVRVSGGKIEFDDSAPLANIRRAITEKRG